MAGIQPKAHSARQNNDPEISYNTENPVGEPESREIDAVLVCPRLFVPRIGDWMALANCRSYTCDSVSGDDCHHGVNSSGEELVLPVVKDLQIHHQEGHLDEAKHELVDDLGHPECLERCKYKRYLL